MSSAYVQELSVQCFFGKTTFLARLFLSAEFSIEQFNQFENLCNRYATAIKFRNVPLNNKALA